ncbi:MAG: hypothetical protein ACOC8L_13910 [Spirochaetota bacterium]
MRNSTRLVLALTLSILTLSCTPGEVEVEAAEPATELAELAAVGGVQDLWAFPFSMTADRETVRESYGEPDWVDTSQPGGDAGSEVIEWGYEGVVFTFFAKADDELESFLSATIASNEVPMNGELAIGMSIEEARGILGEPQVQTEQTLVFFYSDTTIELRYEQGAVREIVLARALP